MVAACNLKPQIVMFEKSQSLQGPISIVQAPVPAACQADQCSTAPPGGSAAFRPQPTFAVRFEIYHESGFNIGTHGLDRYLADPRSRVYLMGVAGDGFSWVGDPRDFDWSILGDALVVVHELARDGQTIGKLRREGVIPDSVTFSCSACTGDLSRWLGAPRSIEGAARELLGSVVSDDHHNYMNGRKMSDAVADGRGEELRRGTRDRAQVIYELWRRFSHLWPDHERQLALLTAKAGLEGVRIDTELAREGQRKLARAMWDAETNIPWADSGDPILSPAALGKQCRAVGIIPPPSLAEDDPDCAEWENKYGDQLPWVGAMRDWRKSNLLHEKFKLMLERTRPGDGRMPFGFNYCGTHTGRWSGGAGFNIQNFPRSGSFGVALRSCIVPGPGKDFISADMAQCEPRLLAELCGNRDLLAKLAEGMPLYEAHARETMGWYGGCLKLEDPGLYRMAKARVIGLGYGCGADRFVEVARALAGLTLTQPEAAQIVDSFRASNPRITGLWRLLEKGLRRSQGEDFEVELPSGRTLVYRDVGYEDGWTARVERGGPRMPFYGGKLCENLVQAVARDVFAEALLRLHRAGIKVVFHIHDEAVCEVDHGTDPREIERLMTIPPDWLAGCPLAAETIISNQYC